MIYHNMIQSNRIIATYLFLLIFNSITYSQNTENCSNWANIDYANCLKNKLPCECERQVRTYFIIKLDTTNSTVLLLKYGDLEEEQFDVRKVSNNKYKVMSINEQNSKCLGEICIKSDRLTYFSASTGKLLFSFFLISKFRNIVEDSKLNMVILNKSFKQRGYKPLEQELRDSVLSCTCISSPLGSVNFLSSDISSNQWILERKSDSLLIYKVINELEIDVPIKKEILRKFKWKIVK